MRKALAHGQRMLLCVCSFVLDVQQIEMEKRVKCKNKNKNKHDAHTLTICTNNNNAHTDVRFIN